MFWIASKFGETSIMFLLSMSSSTQAQQDFLNILEWHILTVLPVSVPEPGDGLISEISLEGYIPFTSWWIHLGIPYVSPTYLCTLDWIPQSFQIKGWFCSEYLKTPWWHKYPMIHQLMYIFSFSHWGHKTVMMFDYLVYESNAILFS